MTKTSALAQVMTTSQMKHEKIRPGNLKSCKIKKGLKNDSKITAKKQTLKGVQSENSNYDKILA